MASVYFFYMKNKYEIKIKNENEFISNILRKYLLFIEQDSSQIIFSYKGKVLSLNNKTKLKYFKNDHIIILVYNLKKIKIQNNEISKKILCPECNSLSMISINEDKISFNCYANKHSLKGLSLKYFIDNQRVNESLIICDKCGNKKNCYINQFYYSATGEKLCPLCYKIKKNGLTKYKNKLFNCYRHNNECISYCNNCHTNLCESCEEEHQNHKIVIYKKIKPNEKKINEIKLDIEENKIKIGQYNYKLEKLNQLISDIFINAKEDIDRYKTLYDIILDLLNNLNNYENINTILNFKMKKLNKEIDYFIKENLNNDFKYLFNKYQNQPNEMKIIYKIIENQSKIRIFGEKFCENNKDNCYLLINNEKYKLTEFYNLNNFEEEYLEIKLLETKIIVNMSYMFYDCSSLISIPNISKWNAVNVSDIQYMFYNCSSLSTLPDISKWNTINITHMNSLLYNCTLLSSLPDISKLNTFNVIDMSYMFCNCKSITSLPDIPKWNTNNVKDMSYMFCGCSSLVSLPDISKWSTNNVTKMNFMFQNCSLLSSLPDISKWNTSNVTQMNFMFRNCKSLSFLPDISKWTINHDTQKKFMFLGCNANLNIPSNFN